MHPLQRDCDITNPKRFAAWAFAAGIPDPSPARPAPIPLITPQLVEGLSEMLWGLGFRHHPDLQAKWISGGAGLGMIAALTDREPERDPVEMMAEEFLGENNPQLLEAIQKAPVEERVKLIEELEKNFTALGELIRRIRIIQDS